MFEDVRCLFMSLSAVWGLLDEVSKDAKLCFDCLIKVGYSIEFIVKDFVRAWFFSEIETSSSHERFAVGCVVWE